MMPFGAGKKPKSETADTCALLSSRGVILAADFKSDPETCHICTWGPHWHDDGISDTYSGGASPALRSLDPSNGPGRVLYTPHNPILGREPVVYLPTHAVPSFVDLVLPMIRQPFRLVTGDCDLAVPAPMVSKHCNALLESECLVAWFAQNCVEPGGKLHQLPIGLDYHSATRGESGASARQGTDQELYLPSQQSPTRQEAELQSIRDSAPPFWERQLKCYSNFHHSIDWSRPPDYVQDRKDAKAGIESAYIEYADKCPRAACWKRMVEVAFIPSPSGNGLDCHRTWEVRDTACARGCAVSECSGSFPGESRCVIQSCGMSGSTGFVCFFA